MDAVKVWDCGWIYCDGTSISVAVYLYPSIKSVALISPLLFVTNVLLYPKAELEIRILIPDTFPSSDVFTICALDRLLVLILT